MKLIDNARIRYVLGKYPIPGSRWREITAKLPVLEGLSSVQRAHLRELATLFLHEKSFTGVQGVEVTPEMELVIAAQASLPVLELGMDYYDGWVEIVVYPGAFRVEHERIDEAGVVHNEPGVLSGESWSRGPVIFSWEDVERDSFADHPGRNVVIHEFAHKLDALNGAANGMPPLHPDMEREAWTESLTQAYEELTRQVAHHHACINPYGATSPAEFFAVLSEYFFTAPDTLVQHCGRVYGQLVLFYRQDPLERAGRE